MALFKKADCAACGNPTNPVTRVKLQDGNCVCSSCYSKIPVQALKSVREHYTLENFHFFLKYVEYSDRELRPIFEETMHYQWLHVDEKHHLFYLGYIIDKKTVFWRMEDTIVFNLAFKPKELKNGITGSKVEGDVLFQLAMRNPYFIYEDRLLKDVKAKAKKELFSTQVTYENPKGMDEFCDRFTEVWMACTEEPKTEGTQQIHLSELQQAMALFMLDSLDGVTFNDLKAHRNRLIKAFHPDKGGATADTRYAQKINNAYEVLKNYIEMNS